ncbi:MAG: serine/threonine-protein kinase HipA [Campylobacterota bacterium]|nr:serine/threonine-protein kinase HipA [Campylobacterota bacterium]
MFGKKIWFGKKELVKFGVRVCYLSETEASGAYGSCIEALKKSIEELERYIPTNPNFKMTGKRILDIWKLSLDEKSYKEIPDEIVRNWTKD